MPPRRNGGNAAVTKSDGRNTLATVRLGLPSRPFSRLSIRVKLPLAAAALILLVGAALSTAAYFAMRRTLLDRASERLATLTAQFKETFRDQMGQSRGRALVTARRPELAAYLNAPAPGLESAALKAMTYEGPQPELNRSVQLRDATGRVVLSAGAANGTEQPPSLGEGDAVALTSVLPALAGSDSGVVGKLRQDGDSLLYPVAARVPGEPGGFFVNWRRVGSAPTARQQISRILGSEAAFFFGNSDGSLWSDLGRITPPPPVEPSRLNGVLRYSRPGRGEVLAAAAVIPGTPWSFTVEFPISAIYAPARAFLRMLAAIAAGCIALGWLGAWLLSRRLVDPLLHQQLEHTVAERTRELQEAQESLVRREKLALLGHLASGVGHEIRNPLGVMNNAVYYLEAVLPDASAEVREYLGILRHQIGLSAKIVNDMLDFSRTTPAHRQPVSLDRIAEEQLKRIDLDGIQVRRDFPAGLPLAQVDPVHAGQVIMNLLTNATQAMEARGGTLELRARAGTNGVVRLEVSDTGPGIPPDIVGKIFEPLFTTKARGIGLGLAVSRSLAQANGGELTVSSESGRGATFTLVLPVAATAP